MKKSLLLCNPCRFLLMAGRESFATPLNVHLHGLHVYEDREGVEFFMKLKGGQRIKATFTA